MKKILIATALLMALGINLQARTLAEAKTICEEGNPAMCIGLGDDFKDNDADKAHKYYVKGFTILEKMCVEDSPDACFSLARLYTNGQGVKKDNEKAKNTYNKAIKLFQISCDKGDVDSCMMVTQTKMSIEIME